MVRFADAVRPSLNILPLFFISQSISWGPQASPQPDIANVLILSSQAHSQLGSFIAFAASALR